MLVSVQANISRSAVSLYHDVSSKILLYIMNRRSQDLTYILNQFAYLGKSIRYYTLKRCECNSMSLNTERLLLSRGLISWPWISFRIYLDTQIPKRLH